MNVAEELVKLFKKQIEHDKREMIFEVLAPLAENGEKINVPLDLLSCILFPFFLILVNCQVFNSKSLLCFINDMMFYFGCL